jgi:uncharacterized protein (TIGR03000 family)
MFRCKLCSFRTVALAIAVCLFFTSESQAQRFFYYPLPSGPFGGPFGNPVSGGPFGGYYGGGGYYPGGGYNYPAFSPSYYYSTPSVYSSSTYILPVITSTSTTTTAPTRSPDEKAAIEVKVPADAKVWFDNRETAQKGTDRYFATPALARGKSYVYEVRATWTDGAGNPVSQTRQVTVEPGKWSVVNFTTGS